VKEQTRLQAEIKGAIAKVESTVAASRKDLLSQMAKNDQDIAEIDTQLSKVLTDNEKRIAEIDSQLSQTRMTLHYQELRAPANEIVFDLKAHTPGFVVANAEPILKIVPGDDLIAKVFITNRDVGFVRPNMVADVRVDSFPFSEFGDVQGHLTWVGSDALPPDQIRPYFTFPAKVKLERQFMVVNSRKIPLQSGMSVAVNLKIRQRTVMSIFTDLFVKNVESLKFVR
jgi:hemolysin D